jgi:hypothetical protein
MIDYYQRIHLTAHKWDMCRSARNSSEGRINVGLINRWATIGLLSSWPNITTIQCFCSGLAGTIFLLSGCMAFSPLFPCAGIGSVIIHSSVILGSHDLGPIMISPESECMFRPLGHLPGSHKFTELHDSVLGYVPWIVPNKCRWQILWVNKIIGMLFKPAKGNM